LGPAIVITAESCDCFTAVSKIAIGSVRARSKSDRAFAAANDFVAPSPKSPAIAEDQALGRFVISLQPSLG